MYSKKITVKNNHIDQLNHVNNVIYLQWVQDIAGEHWGILTKDNPVKNIFWVVLRHEIDYKKEALLEDILTIKTWVGETKGYRSLRHVEFYKKDEMIAKAVTHWCLLDAKSQRPKRIDESIIRILNPE